MTRTAAVRAESQVYLAPKPSGAVTWLRLLQLLAELLSAVAKSAAIIARSVYRSLFPPGGKSLQGEVVLVTGAGHGLGRQLALQFAASGCTVLCVDINQAANEETARDINARHSWRGESPAARAYSCDVADRDQVRRLAEQVLGTQGRVDILVNNAGIMPVQPLLSTQPAQLLDVVNVNLMAHFWTVLAFLPGMVARNHGHLVAISSMAGLCGLANKAPYSASKFAVAGLMDALSEELRLDGKNIKLTCVHPYFLNTRPDLPEDLDLRIPELSPEFAAAEILDAVRHDVDSLTVPRNLLFWINVLRALPPDARNVWRDLFYARVTPASTPPPHQAAPQDRPHKT